LVRINLPIFLGSDIDFSINQAHIDVLNASLASEVLFHPVCSKVSCHAFDAHFDVLYLGFQPRHHEDATEQQQRCDDPVLRASLPTKCEVETAE
jgi:hypothetical protein